ncbi:MAG: hypothetical protein WBQ25_10415 [Nitrososphaeraceae archaeon]
MFYSQTFPSVYVHTFFVYRLTRRYDEDNNLTHVYSEARAKSMEGNISMDKQVKNL